MAMALDPHRITQSELATLGLDHVAFIKSVTIDDETAYAIHAADGTRMGMITDRATAFAAVRQHGLEPVPVH